MSIGRLSGLQSATSNQLSSSRKKNSEKNFHIIIKVIDMMVIEQAKLHKEMFVGDNAVLMIKNQAKIFYLFKIFGYLGKLPTYGKFPEEIRVYYQDNLGQFQVQIILTKKEPLPNIQESEMSLVLH